MQLFARRLEIVPASKERPCYPLGQSMEYDAGCNTTSLLPQVPKEQPGHERGHRPGPLELQLTPGNCGQIQHMKSAKNTAVRTRPQLQRTPAKLKGQPVMPQPASISTKPQFGLGFNQSLGLWPLWLFATPELNKYCH